MTEDRSRYRKRGLGKGLENLFAGEGEQPSHGDSSEPRAPESRARAGAPQGLPEKEGIAEFVRTCMALGLTDQEVDDMYRMYWPEDTPTLRELAGILERHLGEAVPCWIRAPLGILNGFSPIEMLSRSHQGALLLLGALTWE